MPRTTRNDQPAPLISVSLFRHLIFKLQGFHSVNHLDNLLKSATQ